MSGHLNLSMCSHRAHVGRRRLHRDVTLRLIRHNAPKTAYGRQRLTYTFAILLIREGLAFTVNKLLILSVLQLGMLGAILFVLLDRDSEPHAQVSERPLIGQAETLQKVRPVAGSATLDAESVRQIVRSELFEFAAQLPHQVNGQEADASNVDPVERDALISEARERLAFYQAVGEISDTEMEEFQRNISTLDLASRKAMLGELFREINAGNVKVSP